MAEPLADRVIRRIGEAAELYHRLVMINNNYDKEPSREFIA